MFKKQLQKQVVVFFLLGSTDGVHNGNRPWQGPGAAGHSVLLLDLVYTLSAMRPTFPGGSGGVPPVNTLPDATTPSPGCWIWPAGVPGVGGLPASWGTCVYMCIGSPLLSTLVMVAAPFSIHSYSLLLRTGTGLTSFSQRSCVTVPVDLLHVLL